MIGNKGNSQKNVSSTSNTVASVFNNDNSPLAKWLTTNNPKCKQYGRGRGRGRDQPFMHRTKRAFTTSSSRTKHIDKESEHGMHSTKISRVGKENEIETTTSGYERENNHKLMEGHPLGT